MDALLRRLVAGSIAADKGTRSIRKEAKGTKKAGGVAGSSRCASEKEQESKADKGKKWRVTDLLRRLVGADKWTRSIRKEVKGMTKAEVGALLREVGLDDAGKLHELKERLVAYLERCAGEKEQESKGESKVDKGDTEARGPSTALFAANFPLVEIYEGRCLPVKDKFEGLVLDRRQTKAARLLWSRRLVAVSLSYGKQSYAHQMAFLEGMAQFAIPSPSEVRELEMLRKRRREDFGEVEKEYPLQLEDDDGSDERFRGCVLGFAVEDFEILGSGPPSKNLLPDILEHEDIPTGFADAVIFVHDNRPPKRARLQKEPEQDDQAIDTECAAAILQLAGNDKSKCDALFQGAYYAVKHAMANLQKGHGTPVYVIVMTAKEWSYGQLVPEGFVKMRDGGIDEDSLTAFSEHQKITGVAQNNLASLQKKLADGTKFYHPTANYRDGPMLAGTFYLNTEWFPLPKVERGGFSTAGAVRLFDGLARLILGDCVLQMTEADFLRRAELNERITAELLADVM